MDLAIACAGLAILLVAGDLLVRGAVALSVRLGVPTLIIGLTVVSFGTSAPELLVTVQSVLRGVPALALGNVVGSNIANVLLVLGLPALVAAINPGGERARRGYAMMIAATVVGVALCFTGPLGLWHAGVLLTLLALALADMFREARAESARAIEDVASIHPARSVWHGIALAATGIAGLPLGANLLIDGAVGIAARLGASEAAIGLTLVAVGTSLPELATTMMAALRARAEVAFGNVIGSNIFNILGILGITCLFGPVPVADEFLARDLWVMLATALVLLPVVARGWRISRGAGLLFLIAYGIYGYSLMP